MSLFWSSFSHFKIFHFIPLRFFCNIIIPSMSGFSEGSLSFIFPTHNILCTCNMPCLSHPPSRGHPNHLLQFEPTNALNCIKITITLQHTDWCMFRPHRPIIKQHTAVHYSCPEHKLFQLLHSVPNSVCYINITFCSFRQHCYMHKMLSNCSVQLCAPWRWTGGARNM